MHNNIIDLYLQGIHYPITLVRTSTTVPSMVGQRAEYELKFTDPLHIFVLSHISNLQLRSYHSPVCGMPHLLSRDFNGYLAMGQVSI